MREMAYEIGAPSVTTALTAGAPAAAVAIPNALDGQAPRFLLLQSDVLASFQPAAAAGTPLAADSCRLLPGTPLVIKRTSTHIYLRRVAADANVTITPLENGG